jgi:hypothetical protein
VKLRWCRPRPPFCGELDARVRVDPSNAPEPDDRDLHEVLQRFVSKLNDGLEARRATGASGAIAIECGGVPPDPQPRPWTSSERDS